MNLFFWTEEYLKRKAFLESWIYESKEEYFLVKTKNKHTRKEKNYYYFVYDYLEDFKDYYDNNKSFLEDKNIVLIVLNNKKNIQFLKENINFFFNIKNFKILFVNSKENEYWVFNTLFLKKFSDEKAFLKNIKSYIGEIKIL